MDAIKIESLNQLFQAMVEKAASDMHLQVGSPPVFRIQGNPTYMIEFEVLMPELLNKIIKERLNQEQLTYFAAQGDLDFAIGVPGLARFRVNLFKQRGSLGMVARMVPAQIKNIEQLHLPTSISKFCEMKDGLVIFAGATGSGKSTSLAAIIEQINQTRPVHILTIEDPIEQLYRNKKAYINQREVGIDVKDFHAAIRTAVRQDPDIILIGEMRDADTVEFGLSAAETGHLVFATLHSSSVPQTIGRLLDLFPPEKHHQIRMGLHFNLRGIVCQRLVPAIDPEVFRVPSCEIYFNNPAGRKLIKEGEDTKLATIISGSEHEGMQNFNQSLLKLVNQGLVSEQNALKMSPNPEELKMNLQGIFLSKGGLVGG